jgi:hypothetical protein
MFGREGTQNTAKHEAIRAFEKGYRKMLHELGVRDLRNAVVFKEGKMTKLVAFL